MPSRHLRQLSTMSLLLLMALLARGASAETARETDDATTVAGEHFQHFPLLSRQATPALDLALPGLGAISGTVLDRQSGTPLEQVSVRVFDGDGEFVDSSQSDGQGNYTVWGLAPGVYTAMTSGPGSTYQSQFYDGIACTFTVCLPQSGSPITVVADSTTAEIDFVLGRLGTIEGTVLDEGTGEPISGAMIDAVISTGYSQSAYTDSSGHYRIEFLDPGTYFVTTSVFEYINETYDNFPCSGLCDPSAGTPISVALDDTITGIDFALRRGGAISGLVTDATTGEAIEGSVTIYSADGQFAGQGFNNDALGYRATGLLPGDYFATAKASVSNHIKEVYPGLQCLENCPVLAGTPISVALGATTTGVDFSLERGGQIIGKVTDASTEEPIPSITTFWDVEGRLQGFVTNDPSTGIYQLQQLPTGTYYLANGSATHEDVLYKDIPCTNGPPSGCDPVTGTPVAVVAGEVTPEINFEVSPRSACQPSSTSLCLNNGRFRVEAFWGDFDGGAGFGQSVPLTNDSGYFYFFNPENTEIVVKVLDACTLDPFHSFWVFAGGLTNLEIFVNVTDTVTNDTKTYSNPLGNAFQPIRDTKAFLTCTADQGVGMPQTASRQAEIGGDQAISRHLEELLSLASSPLPAHTLGTKGRTTSSSALFLNQGRFRVEATWAASDGSSGQGEAVALSSDTGYFSFFNPDNVEVVVKVLNACTLDPFNNFWVFAAGLTDLHVQLSVTDTVSGEKQLYVNELNTAFLPVQDTRSFATCP